MPRAIRNVKGRIMKVLSENDKLTWLELMKKSELSKGALSKHLNDLIAKGVVETSTVHKRPPSTLYSLREPMIEPEIEIPEALLVRNVKDFRRLTLRIAAMATQDGMKIARLKDRNMAKDVLAGFLEAYLKWLDGFILASLDLAYAYSEGWEEGVEKTKLRKLLGRKDKHEFFLRESQKRIREFVEPYTEALAETLAANHDIAYGSEGIFIKTARELSRSINMDWGDADWNT